MDNSPKKKSIAKSIGVKSTLTFSNKIVLTSFVNSADKDKRVANIEKITDINGNICNPDRQAETMFKASVDKQKIDVVSKLKKADETQLDNPTIKDIGQDYIGIKGELEREYFAREYPNDNLRVQIAYNIIDIKKILCVYVNNIINIFYNLGRNDMEKVTDDIAGQVYTFKDFFEQADYVDNPRNMSNKRKFEVVTKMLKKTSAYHTYFDNVFEVISQEDEDGDKEDKMCYNYDVLRVISLARQISMHDSLGDKNKKESTERILFNLNDNIVNKTPVYWDDIGKILDKTYKRAVKTLNTNFAEHATNNLYILSQIYKKENQDIILQNYYDFVVRKENKNIGVNFTKLRETIVKDLTDDKRLKASTVDGKSRIVDLSDTRYDTYRNKINTIFGYILYYTLIEHKEELSKMISRLRTNTDGEEGKEKIYKLFSCKFENFVIDKFNLALSVFEREKVAKFQSALFTKEEICQKIGEEGGNYAISADNTDAFVKLLYFLCKFLDGKEINELLCAMINKLDNIYELIETAKACGEIVEFREEYQKFFSNCNEWSSQIRLIKNVGHMKPKLKKARERMILDALDMLGWHIEKYQKSADGKFKVGADGKYIPTQDYLNFKRDFFETETSEVKEDGRAKTNRKLYNFVINNIVASKWFFYIAKYCDPRECRKIMRNRQLVEFMLKDIPQTQLKRYCNRVGGGSALSQQESIELLADKLFSFSLNNIKDSIMGGAAAETDKAIIQLYLTVAYVIVKNLIKVNTRFSIAFSICERDCRLFAQKRAESNSNWITATRYFLDEDKSNAEMFAQNTDKAKAEIDSQKRKAIWKENDKLEKKMHYSPRWYDFVNKNFQDAINQNIDFAYFRNKVVHLNIVANMTKYIADAKEVKDYYSLYCYILQRMMIADGKLSKDSEYGIKILKYNQYDKHLMKLLNIPFAYNLARYKNLSIRECYNGKQESDK